ncbi:unnamed protein product [Rotaria sordida]|uniref:Uncharacterized protein n=1 Tax=Rotaria sordida TaxID=392033 RepID=A0A815G7W4_9BILA|nr:unnamed protein product [Rotaria sordida]CAF1594211.1 unnamed protein product [Rotaria sordida]
MESSSNEKQELIALFKQQYKNNPIELKLLKNLKMAIHQIDQYGENNKCSSFIHVYQAQLMSKEEIEILKNSIGNFVSMNSFLSTSLNQ